MKSYQKIIIGVLASYMVFQSQYASSASSQKQEPNSIQSPKVTDTREGLQISAQTLGDTFRKDSIMTLQVTLKNISDSPIAIYKRQGWEGIPYDHVDIQNWQNESVRLVAIPANSPPPKNLSINDFIIIPAGGSIKRDNRINLSNYVIDSIGNYKVTVWYYNPISEVSSPSGIPLWGSENGTIYAKPIIIKIID